LYSLRYISGLVDSIGDDKENPVSQISQIVSSVIECIIEDGKRTAVNHQANSYTPLLWIWLDYPYVGASHGFSGILTMLLQFPKQCQEYMNLIKNTTDYILFKCRQVNGNWPSILSETSNDFIQFCHGAPGICFLACKAYEVFNDEE
jgi:lantibiotic modifying enzyme